MERGGSVMRYGKHFEINGLVNYIGKNIDELQTDIINDPQLALNKIAEHSPVVSSIFRKKVCGVWQEQSQPATEVSSGATSR